jgi:tRNA threonylcarbamoyl adenosine modification protein (Sua5/YciO/YrdC/YwlC family)
LEQLVEHVLSGNCIVYPTTTQPALGCMLQSEALDILYERKKRDHSLPLSIAVCDIEQAKKIVEVPNDVIEILKYFPEGSLTIILKSKNELDSRLGGMSVAVRFIGHEVAKKILEETGPLTATSANISGTKPILNCKKSAEILSTEKYEVIGHNSDCLQETPSTLISWWTVCESLKSPSIEVLREGIVSSKEVQQWWKKWISNNGEMQVT